MAETRALILREEGRALLAAWPREILMGLHDFRSTVSAGSWVTYEVGLRSFFSFVQATGAKSPVDVTSTHITAYIGLLGKDGKSARTIRNYVAAASSFFDFLTRPRDTQGNALIRSNPFKSVREALPRVGRHEDRTREIREIEPDEYQRLLRTCDLSVMGLRDRAVLSLAVWSGRRRRELAGLTARDLRREAGEPVAVFYNKGGGTLRMALREGIWEAIGAYWRASGREPGPSDPVFVSTDPMDGGAKALATSTLDRMIKSRGRQARLDPAEVRVHMHGLRHLCARTLYSMGWDLKKIRDWLGHSRLETTDLYLGRFAKLSVEGMEGLEAFALGRPLPPSRPGPPTPSSAPPGPSRRPPAGPLS